MACRIPLIGRLHEHFPLISMKTRQKSAWPVGWWIQVVNRGGLGA
jgi:hypothetical protein